MLVCCFQTSFVLGIRETQRGKDMLSNMYIINEIHNNWWVGVYRAGLAMIIVNTMQFVTQAKEGLSTNGDMIGSREYGVRCVT